MEEKPQWTKLKAELAKYENGRAVIYIQDGVPVRIVEIEGRKTEIDLTKRKEE